VSADDSDIPELNQWDQTFTEAQMNRLRPIMKRWFRAEVRGMESLPPAGGALLVSNHSGGLMTVDTVILGAAFYDTFGYGRPLYALAHNQLFVGPFEGWLPRAGIIHATRENAAKALRSGGMVLVFPGGDHDAYRPTMGQNVIDFNGRIGYVRTAIEAGAPIVPAVSIGGQETQLFLTRGNWLAKRLGLKRRRVDILPVSIGFPFGLNVFYPPNLPLPAKIVTQLLKPIDIVGEFGRDPDVDEVDAHVRSLMQTALDRLAQERRFPILG